MQIHFLNLELYDDRRFSGIFWLNQYIITPETALPVGGDTVFIFKFNNQAKDKSMVKAFRLCDF